MNHLKIGRDLILKIDQIASANLSAKDDKGKDCIKVTMLNNTQWTVWGNLIESRASLMAVPKINEQVKLIEDLKECIYKYRLGRESNIAKELKAIIN